MNEFLRFRIQLIELFALKKESFFDFLSVGLLHHHLLLHEPHIFLYLTNPCPAFPRVIGVRLGDMVKPEGCMAYFMQSVLELLYLFIFLGLLFFDVAWVHF